MSTNVDMFLIRIGAGIPERGISRHGRTNHSQSEGIFLTLHSKLLVSCEKTLGPWRRCKAYLDKANEIFSRESWWFMIDSWLVYVLLEIRPSKGTSTWILETKTPWAAVISFCGVPVRCKQKWMTWRWWTFVAVLSQLQKPKLLAFREMQLIREGAGALPGLEAWQHVFDPSHVSGKVVIECNAYMYTNCINTCIHENWYRDMNSNSTHILCVWRLSTKHFWFLICKWCCGTRQQRKEMP